MDRNGPEARASFEAEVRSLEGRRISAVDYWGIHNFGPRPSRWDFGDWHHAVMGVQLTTDSGPMTVTWTNRFFPYGVEVFPDAIEHHLALGPTGPERVGPDGLSRWAELIDSPIRRTTVCWETLELGPAVLLATQEIVEVSRWIEIPAALRLDF